MNFIVINQSVKDAPEYGDLEDTSVEVKVISKNTTIAQYASTTNTNTTNKSTPKSTSKKSNSAKSMKKIKEEKQKQELNKMKKFWSMYKTSNNKNPPKNTG